MKNNSSFHILAILSFVFVLSTSSKEQSPGARNKGIKNVPPNIIFIIADDLGWDAFGNYPGIQGPKANSPTLDSLAHKGITFLNFWVNPVCAPTRAALLTGK